MPSSFAYRDHTGRRVDPLLRLHRVTLAEARRRRLRLSPEPIAPPVTLRPTPVNALPVLHDPDVAAAAPTAGEWYAVAAGVT